MPSSASTFCPHSDLQTSSPQKHIALEAAVEMLLAEAAPVREAEIIPLLEASGRVLFDDVFAGTPQPPFHRVLVDGYAVRHCDIAEASARHAVMLRVSQQLFAGEGPGKALAPGEAARVATGAMLPPGADCVIWQEDTENDGDTLIVRRSVEKFRNCRMRGEDIAETRLLVRRGDVLRTVQLSLLAGQGLSQVRVFRRPKVAILATGDELHPSGTPLPPGKIYNISSVMLASRLRELGAELTTVASCGDEDSKLYSKLGALLAENDLLITTGGVSHGRKDYIPSVAERLVSERGGKMLFQGVRIKPGSLNLCMVAAGGMLLGLSGNPAPALTSFEMLAVPMLKKMSARRQYRHERQKAVAQDNFGTCRKDSRRLIMAQMIGQKVFIRQQEHVCTVPDCIHDYNCFIDVPAGGLTIHAGDEVDVILL